jgi:hypothetical protein
MNVLRNIVARSRNCWNGNATMLFLCVAELCVTVNNTKIMSFAQKLISWRVCVAGNNTIYFGLHVKMPDIFARFLSNFEQFHKTSQYQIS